MRALAPDLEVLAPVRVWGFTREDSIDYAAKHDIPINVTKKSPYSIDENLWGRTVECGILEDPWVAPPEDVYELTKGPAPAEPREIVIGVRAGGARPRSMVRALPLPAARARRRPRRSARTAGGASTWSRTAAWASRAARSTSAPARSR